MSRPEENHSDDLDNRHNNGHIGNDVAIDEINYYLSEYTKRVTKFEAKKRINERFTFVSLVIVLLSAGLIYSPFLFGVDVLEYGYSRLAASLLLSTAGIILFVSYLVNRLKGYTRAWSRNRLMIEQLEILAREYRLSIRDKELPKDREYINIEQENILSKLFELESKNRIETHADIVGDYIAAHEGVFSWVKGLRK
ncbi:hypothetical protein A2I96_06005 [Pseudoalteromonas tetraodonis]|uniref:SMODS and SLOG-associating 2TM effector domain-containing protein n=1 Tax=Pseudoalteromonas tetraodonis TaxID=43659 RepID=A0ABD4ESB1_9GAMM|nr:DUF5336 domain-containing protein [Pseudoalteromonas spiralis]KYL37198.1 hypothetical protein A2I96_06005 [Pseudoalteromonas spiralis]